MTWWGVLALLGAVAVLLWLCARGNRHLFVCHACGVLIRAHLDHEMQYVPTCPVCQRPTEKVE